MTTPSLGALLHAFLTDELPLRKGLRPASIKAHRDALRLFLVFIAADVPCRLSQIALDARTLDRVRRFLQYLEENRHNHRRTRNHRLTVLHAFFDFLARRVPECLAVAQQVAGIPFKRVPPPETRFLDRDTITQLFAQLPKNGRFALRDRAILLFLYNTAARVQEVADLRVADIQFGEKPWGAVARQGRQVACLSPLGSRHRSYSNNYSTIGPPLHPRRPSSHPTADGSLTRFGIYKIVRRHTAQLHASEVGPSRRHISPHLFRHTGAVHLLESGVDPNVIRGWLGHVSLETTNRYAEITMRAKEAALKLCEPPPSVSAVHPRKPPWRDDQTLLAWLSSL